MYCREESENLKQTMTSSSKDETPVIPYESLDLTSDGNDCSCLSYFDVLFRICNLELAS